MLNNELPKAATRGSSTPSSHFGVKFSAYGRQIDAEKGGALSVRYLAAA